MQGWLWWCAGVTAVVVVALAITLIVSWVLGYSD